MNILELDSYNLGDAVKFNNRLNSKLWGPDEKLRPKVREQLLRIASDFQEFLGIDNFELKDITISGSNAAYTYTPHSDIDLHLVVDLPEADKSEVYRELFDAKKYQYNDIHNIKIGGYDVELYVQNANKTHVSQGIYSVLNNEWIDVPKHRRPKLDDISIKSKYEDLSRRIDTAINSKSREQMEVLTSKIKEMRQAGLDQHGEFSPENLAFKILRSQGKIKELYDARNQAKDRELSLRERAIEPKVAVKYGFKTPVREDADLTWDGVNPTTDQVVNEGEPKSDEESLKDFVKFCVEELKIKHMPTIKLRKDPQWAVVHRTFGRYINDKQLLEVAWGQRHLMDVFRTVAHELTHRRQHERDGDRMGPEAGETGSKWENEANARAGILMRDYGRLHPELFADGQAQGLALGEGIKSNIAAAAIVSALTGNASAEGIGSILGLLKNATTIAQQAKNITRAGINSEVQQEIVNYVRAQGGQPGAQNLSHLYRLQRELERQEDGQPLPGYTQQSTTNESASGYIPTKRQAKDPRYKMALTVDIHPGQLGKEANKLKLKTDSQGYPQLANPNGLVESLRLQLENFKNPVQAKNNIPSTWRVKNHLTYEPLTAWVSQQGREVDEGDVIHHKFGMKQDQKGKTPYYKNPDIEIPKTRSGEDYDRFEVVSAGKNTSHIIGVKDGRRVQISTANSELATVLANAYNRGGFTDVSIQRVPLGDYFKEAIGLNAPHRKVSDKEMQDYLKRVKSKEKDKGDYYTKPHVHASSLKFVDDGEQLDLEEVRRIITRRPKQILKQNEKMQHSDGSGEVYYNIGLPALKGLAVDEDTDEFVFVDTCPGAGDCQQYCYVKKGSYIMFKGPWESMSRMLNFLLNDPEGFANRLSAEIADAEREFSRKGWKVNIRWHDAGDFFSPEYLDLAFNVARRFPNVNFYAYTKMGAVATGNRPDNFNLNWSGGAAPAQRKVVQIHKQTAEHPVKHAETVPKEMFKGLLVKDAVGKWQWTSPEAFEKFKQSLAAKYNIDSGSIVTYDQIVAIPRSNDPKWNVIVKPGEGDTSANRRDVIGTYLLFH